MRPADWRSAKESLNRRRILCFWRKKNIFDYNKEASMVDVYNPKDGYAHQNMINADGIA